MPVSLYPFDAPNPYGPPPFDGKVWYGGHPSLAAIVYVAPCPSGGWHGAFCKFRGDKVGTASPVTKEGVIEWFWQFGVVLGDCSWSVCPNIIPSDKNPFDGSATSTRVQSGFVYFIQSGDEPFVKIGTTHSVVGRVEQLQTASPHRLKLLATCGASEHPEHKLHAKFAAHRVRADGEWFHLVPEIVAFISSLTERSAK